MDSTIRNHIKLGLLLIITFSGLIVIHYNVENAQIRSSPIPSHLSLKIQSTAKVQEEFEFELGNITSDVLQIIAELIWKGDGSGITEIIWNLLPIVGNNNATDALLYPIFLILISGGVYRMLQKQGVLD